MGVLGVVAGVGLAWVFLAACIGPPRALTLYGARHEGEQDLGDDRLGLRGGYDGWTLGAALEFPLSYGEESRSDRRARAPSLDEDDQQETERECEQGDPAAGQDPPETVVLPAPLEIPVVDHGPFEPSKDRWWSDPELRGWIGGLVSGILATVGAIFGKATHDRRRRERGT